MEPRPGSVGDSLRRARIAQGLSIEDVEATLHVRQHVVQALETDDFAGLPPTVYTRALIRDFARLVGLDPADLLERSVPMRPQDRNPIRPAIQPLERPPLISFKAVFIVTGVLLLVGLFAYLYTQLNSFADSVDAAQARAQPLPTQQSRAISALLTPLPTPAPGPTETPAPTPTPITGLVIEARVTDRSWVQVWADGRSVVAQTLPPGTTQTFTADQSVRMRVGNAGGVDITANGTHQGRLGSTGQVLDALWGRDDGTPTAGASQVPLGAPATAAPQALGATATTAPLQAPAATSTIPAQAPLATPTTGR